MIYKPPPLSRDYRGILILRPLKGGGLLIRGPHQYHDDFIVVVTMSGGPIPRGPVLADRHGIRFQVYEPVQHHQEDISFLSGSCQEGEEVCTS